MVRFALKAPMNSLQGTRLDPGKSTKTGAFWLPHTAVPASLPDIRQSVFQVREIRGL